MQDSLPSGSARTIHDRSPWPTSTRVAPSASSRSTSASRSPGRKSRCNRFLIVIGSGTETNSSPGRRSAAGRISNSPGSTLTTTMAPSARAGGRAGQAAPGNLPMRSRNGPISWIIMAHVTTPDAPRPDRWIPWLSQGGDTGSNPVGVLTIEPTGKDRVSAAELGFSQSRATMWWYLAGFTSTPPQHGPCPAGQERQTGRGIGAARSPESSTVVACCCTSGRLGERQELPTLR
jgi:hypothetical protein